MSLVGTRPPTVDEWDKYELHHRARLATKPGLDYESYLYQLVEFLKRDGKYEIYMIPHISEGFAHGFLTLIGKDGDNSISVEDMANLAGSFNYEFVCDVGKRVPRVYIK